MAPGGRCDSDLGLRSLDRSVNMALATVLSLCAGCLLVGGAAGLFIGTMCVASSREVSLDNGVGTPSAQGARRLPVCGGIWDGEVSGVGQWVRPPAEFREFAGMRFCPVTKYGGIRCPHALQWTSSQVVNCVGSAEQCRNVRRKRQQ